MPTDVLEPHPLVHPAVTSPAERDRLLAEAARWLGDALPGRPRIEVSDSSAHLLRHGVRVDRDVFAAHVQAAHQPQADRLAHLKAALDVVRGDPYIERGDGRGARDAVRAGLAVAPAEDPWVDAPRLAASLGGRRVVEAVHDEMLRNLHEHGSSDGPSSTTLEIVEELSPGRRDR